MPLPLWIPGRGYLPACCPSAVDVIWLCSDFSNTTEGFSLHVALLLLFHEIEEGVEAEFCTV